VDAVVSLRMADGSEATGAILIERHRLLDD
jgi:hypothetical protein